MIFACTIDMRITTGLVAFATIGVVCARIQTARRSVVPGNLPFEGSDEGLDKVEGFLEPVLEMIGLGSGVKNGTAGPNGTAIADATEDAAEEGTLLVPSE